ncbi:MAG TPA: hypothetical protein VH372_23760 [Actinospica sp.]|jgi:hypothetical protein|nr:hypothetical protein [Actinospica sp.]
MTEYTRTAKTREKVRNKAQEERHAVGRDLKKLADTASVEETWEHASGHSGTRRAWAVSIGMVAAFLLAAGGMTFGPRVLQWVGVGGFVVLGVYSLAARTWTDYVHDTRRSTEEDASALRDRS